MISPRHVPPLDPTFVAASLWNRAFRTKVAEEGQRRPLSMVLERPDGSTSSFRTEILPHEGLNVPLNRTYVGRLVKSLLWSRGGHRLFMAGPEPVIARIREVYSPTGSRKFDAAFVGRKIFGRPFEVVSVSLSDLPSANRSRRHLGGHTDGCRIGFDLGGTHRRCAAVQDGKVLFYEEVPWDPYFQSDPKYHLDGLNDSIRRAAAHLPRVDAIGGSASAVYVSNEPRVGSLFRGVAPPEFEASIRPIFHRLKEEWKVPLEVVNDGEAAALAGSMALKAHGVLGLSLSKSVGAGYVTTDGSLTPWLNELAFVPIDFRENAPIDEWSGDRGCAADYFTQHAIARLAARAGLELPREFSPAEQLKAVRELMERGDERVIPIYQTLGIQLGYAIGHYADLYELAHVLLVGRVTKGPGGAIILEHAQAVLRDEFPEIVATTELHMPGDSDRAQAQAVAAASLPSLA